MCGSVLAFAMACSGAASCTGSPAPAARATDPVSALGLNLVVPPGVGAKGVSYTISGNGYSRTGTIDISAAETTFSTAITKIPAGQRYQITLSAIGSDGTPGTGSAMFDISPRATTTVSVVLRFVPALPAGDPNGDDAGTNQCPCIGSLRAKPHTLKVGESSEICADAHDSDHRPSPLTYSWTVSPSDVGTLSDTSSPNPTFTARAAGTARVTLNVSDGDPACETGTTGRDSLFVELTVEPAHSGGAGACARFEPPVRRWHFTKPRSDRDDDADGGIEDR